MTLYIREEIVKLQGEVETLHIWALEIEDVKHFVLAKTKRGACKYFETHFEDVEFSDKQVRKAYRPEIWIIAGRALRNEGAYVPHKKVLRPSLSTSKRKPT